MRRRRGVEHSPRVHCLSSFLPHLGRDRRCEPLTTDFIRNLGTRGPLGYILRSRNLKKATYNHYDSYPSALGVELADFIQSLSDEQIEQMKANLAKIQWIPGEEEREVPSKELVDRYDKFRDQMAVAQVQPINSWYTILRGVQGAKALPYIMDGSLTHLIDSTPFEQEDLFCEWVYWVDWEERSVRVEQSGAKSSKVDFKNLTPEWMRQL